jgi:hypothetical protein
MQGCAQKMGCHTSGFDMRQIQTIPPIHNESVLASALINSPIRILSNRNSFRRVRRLRHESPFTTIEYRGLIIILPCFRTALLWVNTQRVVVNPFRRFGTTYRSPSLLPPSTTLLTGNTLLVTYHSPYSSLHNPRTRVTGFIFGNLHSVIPVVLLIISIGVEMTSNTTCFIKDVIIN